MRHSTHLNILMTLAFVTACGGSGGGSGGSSPTKLFTTNQAATMVIGQSDFVTRDFSANTNSTATNQDPYGVAIVGTKLFIADNQGNRVLGFNTLPTAATSRLISADFALGQPSGVTNLTSRAEGTGISQMKSPSDVHARGNYLAVSDLLNNRILIYNSIPSAAGATPVAAANAGTTCSQNGLKSPASVYITPAGKLIVADFELHRVMIWNSISALYNNPTKNADLILGSSSCTSGTGLNQMFEPGGVWSDDNRLVVADSENHRVLIWNTFPTSSSQPASFILGETSTRGTTANLFKTPFRVSSDGSRLAVNDYENHRVLLWNTFPTSPTPADVVIGQSNMTTGQANAGNSGPSNLGLQYPVNVYLDNNKLWVADSGNLRTLVFEAQ